MRLDPHFAQPFALASAPATMEHNPVAPRVGAGRSAQGTTRGKTRPGCVKGSAGRAVKRLGRFLQRHGKV
jgi:hypothetical protein